VTLELRLASCCTERENAQRPLHELTRPEPMRRRNVPIQARHLGPEPLISGRARQSASSHKPTELSSLSLLLPKNARHTTTFLYERNRICKAPLYEERQRNDGDNVVNPREKFNADPRIFPSIGSAAQGSLQFKIEILGRRCHAFLGLDSLFFFFYPRYDLIRCDLGWFQASFMEKQRPRSLFCV
jgi:hypothetical protein